MGNDELTNYFEQAEYYKFKYEGDNDISLIALNQTLSAINELTKLAVNNQFEYEFKISATEKGSFILDIYSIAYVTANLINPDNILYMKNCLSVVTEWINIKKHLGDKPPKKVEHTGKEVNITNCKGTVLHCSLEGAEFLNNAQIGTMIVNLGCGLERGKKTGFKLMDEKNQEIISIDESDYDVLTSESCFATDNKVHNDVIKNANLIIIKPDLYGDSKWELYLNKRIKAKIDDKHWKSQVENHQVSFMRGTIMRADLRIEVDLDEYGLPVENSDRYYVDNVYGITQPEITDEDQTKL